MGTKNDSEALKILSSIDMLSLPIVQVNIMLRPPTPPTSRTNPAPGLTGCSDSSEGSLLSEPPGASSRFRELAFPECCRVAVIFFHVANQVIGASGKRENLPAESLDTDKV